MGSNELTITSDDLRGSMKITVKISRAVRLRMQIGLVIVRFGLWVFGADATVEEVD